MAMRNTLWIIGAALLWIFAAPLHAQDNPANHPVQVFVRTEPADPAARTLLFVDLLTGRETAVQTYGTRFTVAERTVLYWDERAARVKSASPDGTVRDHPFMQPSAGAARIDWVLSRDNKRLAWTETFRDANGQLSTITSMADSDGANRRVVFNDGPRADGLRVLPVAFSADAARLYMDYQPDGLAELTAFPQYAALFALNLEDGTSAFLPNEPDDFTGAAFGAGFFIRLTLTDDGTAFDVRVVNLDKGYDALIPAERRSGFTQGGAILIAPDGRYAVYTLAEITQLGTPNQQVRTVFMLIDLVTMTQQALTEPITTFVRPTAWTEDNSAVIFTSPQQDGTWKITLQDRRLNKIAEPTYLGALQITLE